jgi:uncharacterized membrane protein
MSDRPVFIFAATYGDRADAEADYELLLEAHSAKLVGTYDVALIRKDADGKVHVEKHEKPTQHGTWGGLAVGALVGVLFPPSVIGAAVVGGAVGGVGGHLRKGMSRGDAVAESLDRGHAVGGSNASAGARRADEGRRTPAGGAAKAPPRRRRLNWRRPSRPSRPPRARV